MRYHPGNIQAWWADRQRADAIQWTRLSAEMGDYARVIAGRDDLIAVVEPGTGKGHPAVYLPEQASVEVNPDVCAPGVDPADVSATTEVERLRHPAFHGALTHEAAHAAFSQWEIDQSRDRFAVVKSALLLEEARAEQHMLRRYPEVRVLLRATYSTIVKGASEPSTVRGAAQMLALTDARVDAGVLDADEVAGTIAHATDVLGVGRYYALRALWREALALGNHTDQAAMEALGERWNAVLDAKGDADPESEGPLILICSMPGEPGGEGDSPAQSEAEAVSASAEEEAEEETGAAAARDVAKERAEEAKAAKGEDKTAEQVFTRIHGHSSGSGGEGLLGTRMPTPAERGQANVLANRLRKAQHRERTRTVVSSTTPPGRLRASAAVKRSAERSMGLVPTAEPWRQTVRKRVEEPPITVGLACDISGSMRWATEAVASAAWVISHAVHRNDGDTATVAYGQDVHPVVRPGERPQAVREFNASGGWENWTRAIAALSGALSLTQPTGVRVAVFISDGHYRSDQRINGEKMLARLVRSGVKVLWIGFHGTDSDRPPAGVEYVHLTDPSQMGSVIGSAMVRLLERA